MTQPASWEPDVELPEHLHGLSGSELDDAILQIRGELAANPRELDNYHHLYKLWMRAGQPDRAWCAAGLLSAFGKATKREWEFYHSQLLPGVVEPWQPLDASRWDRFVTANEQDQRLSELFAVIYNGVGKRLPSNRLKDFGLNERDAVDLSSRALICQTLLKVASVLGVPAPPVYLNSKGSAVRVLPTVPLAVAIGPDILRDTPEKALAFVLGKSLAYFHPWHKMAALYDAEPLQRILVAASHAVDAATDFYDQLVPDDKEERKQVAKLIKEFGKRMSDDEKELLIRHLVDFAAEGVVPDVDAWDRHVELTTNHAGLVVADDIEMVGRILMNEVSALSSVTRQQKIDDFVRFVMSESYHRLREELNIAIRQSDLGMAEGVSADGDGPPPTPGGPPPTPGGLSACPHCGMPLPSA